LHKAILQIKAENYQSFADTIFAMRLISMLLLRFSNAHTFGRFTTINANHLEPFRSSQSANKCPTYTTCLNCLLDYSCAWCSGTNQCLSRNEILQAQTSLCSNASEGKIVYVIIIVT